MAAPKDFDLLKIAGLKRKPRLPERYASFNKRMMAMSIDSFIILIFFAPMIDTLVASHFPITPIDLDDMQARLGYNAGFVRTLSLFFEESYKAGLFARWCANSLLQGALFALLSGLCWHFWSTTPGKFVMRIRLADAKTEGPVSDKQIMLRLLGYVVSTVFLLAGFIAIGFSKNRQGWHDKMADTVVLVQPIAWREFYAKTKARFRSGSPAGNPSNSQEP